MAGAAAASPGTEGLPRAFLQSLRTLFDILDDRRRGYVHLREIETRWQGADARELPRGVLEGLRREAPASGYLTFERFVAGLRAALPGPGDDEPRDLLELEHKALPPRGLEREPQPPPQGTPCSGRVGLGLGGAQGTHAMAWWGSNPGPGYHINAVPTLGLEDPVLQI